MLRTLQAGRGVAAIAVLLYHLNLELVARFGGASVSGLEVGWAGVDFFFVLSGFIIWHVHAGDIGQDGRLGRYLWNRFTRLYPVYWAVLAVALALLFAGSSLGPRFGGPGFGGLGFGAADARDPLTILSSILLAPLGTGTVVGQAWTLYYEVIFYALFGLTIWKPRLGALLLGAWFLAAVASSLSSERVWNALREPLRLFVSPLNLLFGLGMAAAWALRRRPPARGGLLVGAGAAVFALAAAFAFMTGGADQPAITHLGLGLGSALCVLGLAGLEREGRAKTPQFLVALGGASYSIYLTHTFALSFGARLLAPWRPQPFVAFVLLGVFALLAGWLFHRLIERPLLLWTRKGREPAAAAVV